MHKLYSVVEVLEKHGLQKPISYVKNSQSSEEEAHQLMVKLCRHTGRKYGLKKTRMKKDSHEVAARYIYICLCVSRNPPVSETVWRGLLQDLLDMQQNVYTCLKPEICHQVIHPSKKTAKEYIKITFCTQLLSRFTR